MTRVAQLFVLSTSLCLGGCLFDEKKEVLTGKRLDVLQPTQTVDQKNIKVALSSPTQNTRWSQGGGNATHTLGHLALKGNLSKKWSISIGKGSALRRQLIAAPVVDKGIVYTLDTSALLSAHRLQTGAFLWRTPLLPKKGESGIAHGGLAVEDGVLYAATGFAKLIALKADTGEHLWTQSFKAPLRAAPTVSHGRVFVMTADNQMHACKTIDGQIEWTQMGLSETTGVVSGASPAVQNEFVIFGHSSGDLTCHRIENGTLLWDDNLIQVRRTTAFSKIGSVRHYPVISGQDVYAIGHNGRLAAIDLQQGTTRWDRQLNGYGAPVLDRDVLFTVTYDGKVMCLSRKDGATQWVTELKAFKKDKDRSSRILWTTPLLAGGRLFIGSADKQLVELDATTGNILRTIAFQANILISPIVVDNTLLVITDTGHLIAYA